MLLSYCCPQVVLTVSTTLFKQLRGSTWCFTNTHFFVAGKSDAQKASLLFSCVTYCCCQTLKAVILLLFEIEWLPNIKTLGQSSLPSGPFSWWQKGTGLEPLCVWPVTSGSRDNARADAAWSHPGLLGASLVILFAASNIYTKECQVVVDCRGVYMGQGVQGK